MIVTCLGRRELGKTTLAWFMAQRSDRVIALDPRAMFPTADPIGDLPGDAGELWRRLQDPDDKSPIVVQPADDLPGTVNALARIVREWCQNDAGTLAVILDECGLLDLRAWDWVFRCSPRDRITVILTAHRPRDISTTVRALADTWCIFRTTQPHDLDALADRCGDDVVLRVRALAPREFVCWDDARGQLSLYRDPSMWFVPLAQTRGAFADAPLPSGAVVPARSSLPLLEP